MDGKRLNKKQFVGKGYIYLDGIERRRAEIGKGLACYLQALLLRSGKGQERMAVRIRSYCIL